MQIREINDLHDEWRILLPEPQTNKIKALRRVLRERLAILHRLNELSETAVEGKPIIAALEETNKSIRQIGKTNESTCSFN